MASQSERTVAVDWDDPIDAIEKAFELGWSDGLPIVPPTVERVDQFIGLSQRGPNEVLGELPERRREVNVRTAAANAVMAGCLPEHFPVVLAATEAMLEPDFNLVGPLSSLGGSAILTIVNGPIARDLNINSRNNLFGPGNRANATIGRAIRLILMNACAAIPGLFDRSILGHPGKYTYCIAEAETETHWTPLHVERGFSASQSTVTVFACEGPRHVRTMGGPENIVFTVADVASSLGTSMSTVGSSSDASAVVRQGEIAIIVSGESRVWDGWSKDDFRRALLPRIKRSMADLKRGGEVREELSPGDEDTYLPLIASLEDIIVIFAGGAERTTCAVIPSWGPRVASSSVTRAIRVSG